ncbi:sensor histidine kinase [Glycomyces albidus]|uniref:sensor histidine kinase n=1 Tax=Glycomyces albidus TaxID=2656774 RepID=UPI002AD3D36B|nr:HAMP domain-containing sensor histidine kinase [Glycomyces albidus]
MDEKTRKRALKESRRHAYDKRLLWRPESVRARTTVGATVVVAIALIVAGFLVVTLLRDNLYGRAELTAEVNARSIAGQLASGTAPGAVELPDDDEAAQIVAANGDVVAASEDLAGMGAVGDFAPAPDPVTETTEDADDGDDGGTDDDDTDDQTDDDDDDADDGDSDGGDSDDNATETQSPSAAPEPTQGAVGSSIAYETVTLRSEGAPYRFAAMNATAPDGTVYTVYSGASLETQEEAVESVTATMWWALPALLAVVAVVTWLVTRRALRPVGAIQKELISITGGDLSRRVPVPASRDEIHSLAVTTNTTLAALDHAVSQQRRFVADASHELRSPLAILRSQIEIAREHPELLDLDATHADVIRLQDLAADLLLLARLDAGERPPHTEVPFTELVREEVARRAASDRVPVRLEVEEDLSVFGVRGHLARAVGNLLANAQRHAATAVTVTLAAEDDEWLFLDVGDDGNGVPAGDRRRIFDRFVRLDESRSRDEGGAGLGLAIVQDVVLAHRGMVQVLESPEGGALFRMALRRADRRPPQASAEAGGPVASGPAP